jgi:hypothetical protein
VAVRFRQRRNAERIAAVILRKVSWSGPRNSVSTVPEEAPVAELRLLIVPITAIMEARHMQTSLVSTMVPEMCISSDSMDQRTKSINQDSIRQINLLKALEDENKNVHDMAT